jgi:hypothetical protein
MKLVFWAGIGGDNIPVRPLGTSSVPVNWCALHWAPTEEDWGPRGRAFRWVRRLGFGHFMEPKWVRDLYTDFTTLCLPEGGFIYAVLDLTLGIGNFYDLQESLNEKGLCSFVVSEEGRRREAPVLVAELHREHVKMVFEDNTWAVGRHFFFISRKEIPAWAEQLKESVHTHGFNYELLNSMVCVLCNFYEHGIEATSTVMTIEALRDIASRVSDRLNVPMEIE